MYCMVVELLMVVLEQMSVYNLFFFIESELVRNLVTSARLTSV